MSDPGLPRSTDIYLSQRLSSWVGHLFFLLTASATLAAMNGSFGGSHFSVLVLLPLLILCCFVGTFVWRRLITRRPTAIYHYFAVQLLLIGVQMLLESAMGVRGPSASILGIAVTFQSAVVPRRDRVRLFVCLLLLVVLLYTLSMGVSILDLEQIVLFILLFGGVYAFGLFLGSLIVREEQAQETSRRLDESNRKLTQYAAEIESLSTVQERNRLAREIHDNLGHYLTAVNIQLELALLADPQRETPSRSALLKAQLLTKEALAEIRRSINALRATPLENRAVHDAIALLVEEHRAADHRIEFHIAGTIRPCSPTVEMTVYRIAQEGLTNIRKHAHNESAEVILDYRVADHITLEVRDDGVGSDLADGGFGLLGIRERIELLNGTLTIETAKGQGFALRAVIPD